MIPLSQLPDIAESERQRLRNLALTIQSVAPPSVNDQIQAENLALHAQVIAAQATEKSGE